MEKKKPLKPAGAKKVTRRKRKVASSTEDSGVYLDIDQVYKAINRVQINRDTASFIIKDSDSPIVENILKDLELPFKRKKAKVEGLSACYEYTVNPGKEKIRTDHLSDIEEFPDEILEDGQVFF